MLGSSPQVRGRLPHPGGGGPAGGLIPAGAGQTRSLLRLLQAPTAHPRRCGADDVLERDRISHRGSFPQVRGRREATRRCPPGHGLIPAGAGKTDPRCWHSRGPWAHPRRCGADIRLAKDANGQYGSSPQVRGRPATGISQRVRLRLIPAGAGQTWRPGCPRAPLQAHPRRCGADCGRLREVGTMAGSSPQVRGRLTARVDATIGTGLIPAGAGQTVP